MLSRREMLLRSLGLATVAPLSSSALASAPARRSAKIERTGTKSYAVSFAGAPELTVNQLVHGAARQSAVYIPENFSGVFCVLFAGVELKPGVSVGYRGTTVTMLEDRKLRVDFGPEPV